MRRVLLVLALAASPLLAPAQDQEAGFGQVIDVDNFQAFATTPTSYINAEQCAAGTANPKSRIDWEIRTESGIFNPAVGNIVIFASSVAPATVTGKTLLYCSESDVATGTPIEADQVATFAADVTPPQAVSGAAIVAATGKLCTNEGATVYVCAHWKDADVKLGVASGRFMIQTEAPSPPTNVSATAGENALNVSWDAPASSSPPADRYRIVLTPEGSTTPITREAACCDERVGGLQNGVPYTVQVASLSVGGNPSSPASAADPVAPVPVDSFYEYYRRKGGVDEGGCASGSAGALALLGLASLISRRRRTK